MKILSEKDCKLKIVETKTGAKLLLIDMWDVQYLEQNTLKDSKYGVAYRKLKAIYPDLYMFWEIKDGDFTWNLKLELLASKKDIDNLIDNILSDSSYKDYEDTQPSL